MGDTLMVQSMRTSMSKLVCEWELVTANFELKCLLNFLEIWKKIRKKEPSDLDKSKK